MNSGPVSERVYAALKRLIRHRRFRPGQRLDPARLADELNSSVTPVRDALHILVGEGLVETRTGEGFQLPGIDEPGLRDLYAWNGQLLLQSLRDWPRAGVRRIRPAAADHEQDERQEALFLQIAAFSTNAEHPRALAALNDRLHSVRLVEAQRLETVDEELSMFESAVRDGDAAMLRKLVPAFHARRRRVAADLVRLLYRSD